MKKEFQITRPVNVILIEITGVILILATCLYIFIIFNHYSKEYRYVTFLIAEIAAPLLLLVRKYKAIGKIIIDREKINIRYTNREIDLPVSSIKTIRYYFKKSPGKNYIPNLFLPIGIYALFSPGYLLQIQTNQEIYQLDIFLSTHYDINTLENQIRGLADLGVEIQKVKLASFLRNQLTKTQ